MLELGSGAGRVALHLARRGQPVWAVDRDVQLIDALAAQASREGLDVHAVLADLRTMALRESFELIIAPMQLVQMLDGSDGRIEVLRACVVSPRRPPGAWRPPSWSTRQPRSKAPGTAFRTFASATDGCSRASPRWSRRATVAWRSAGCASRVSPGRTPEHRGAHRPPRGARRSGPRGGGRERGPRARGATRGRGPGRLPGLHRPGRSGGRDGASGASRSIRSR